MIEKDRDELCAFLDMQMSLTHDFDPRECVACLHTFGKEAAARGVIALARQAMKQFEQSNESKVPPALRDVPRELVVIAESRISRLNEPFNNTTSVIIARTQEEPHLLAEQDGLIKHATWMSICLFALLTTGQDWKRALIDAASDARMIWGNNPEAARLINAELRPWIMDSGDILKSKPTKFPC